MKSRNFIIILIITIFSCNKYYFILDTIIISYIYLFLFKRICMNNLLK